MARAMKDSGVEWIGEIPEHWEVVKIKRLFREINERNEDDENAILLSLFTAIGVKPRSEMEERGNKAMTVINYKIVKPNDLVVNKLLAWMGAIGYSDFEGVTSPDYDVYRELPNANVVRNYYNSYFRHTQFKDDCFKYGRGIMLMRWRTYPEQFKNISVVNPPLSEQQQIADFLDDKTSQIDSIIENTKQSIVEFKKYKQALITETVTKGLNPDVKMKNSGIEWIGEIPEHCSLKKVRIVASKIGSGKTPRGGAEVYSDSGILFLRSQNVYDTGLYLEEATYISQEIDNAMRNTRVFPNDVLLNITGASIGRCCVYPENMKCPANVNQHVCIIRPIVDKIIPRFLTYFFNSNAGQSAIKYYQTGGNREGLNFEQIGNIRIPYYSIGEQQQIVDFLDEKTAHIDSLISNKEQIVQDLETYKKAMIYEYVTGKKEVE